MKNFIAIFTVALILVFTSCTKEELFIEEETVSVSDVEANNLTMHLGKKSDVSPAISTSKSSQTEVTKISSTISGKDLLVDFSSTEDLSNVILEAVQHLDFTDGSGNESTLTFLINSFSYNSGLLHVNFSINGNDLTGLNLESTQYIIIQDDLVD